MTTKEEMEGLETYNMRFDNKIQIEDIFYPFSDGIAFVSFVRCKGNIEVLFTLKCIWRRSDGYRHKFNNGSKE